MVPEGAVGEPPGQHGAVIDVIGMDAPLGQRVQVGPGRVEQHFQQVDAMGGQVPQRTAACPARIGPPVVRRPVRRQPAGIEDPGLRDRPERRLPLSGCGDAGAPRGSADRTRCQASLRPWRRHPPWRRHRPSWSPSAFRTAHACQPQRRRPRPACAGRWVSRHRRPERPGWLIRRTDRTCRDCPAPTGHGRTAPRRGHWRRRGWRG